MEYAELHVYEVPEKLSARSRQITGILSNTYKPHSSKKKKKKKKKKKERNWGISVSFSF